MSSAARSERDTVPAPRSSGLLFTSATAVTLFLVSRAGRRSTGSVRAEIVGERAGGVLAGSPTAAGRFSTDGPAPAEPGDRGRRPLSKCHRRRRALAHGGPVVQRLERIRRWSTSPEQGGTSRDLCRQSEVRRPTRSMGSAVRSNQRLVWAVAGTTSVCRRPSNHWRRRSAEKKTACGGPGWSSGLSQMAVVPLFRSRARAVRRCALWHSPIGQRGICRLLDWRRATLMRWRSWPKQVSSPCLVTSTGSGQHALMQARRRDWPHTAGAWKGRNLSVQVAPASIGPS